MNTKTKSTLIVLGALLIGIIVGGLATSTIYTKRIGDIRALRMQGGFVQFLENVIEPVDDTQREQIREILQAAAVQQMELRRTVFEENRAVFEDMRAQLDIILTDEQKARLREWVRNERRAGPAFGPPPEFNGRRPERAFGGAGFRERLYRDSLGGRRFTPRRFEAGGVPSDSTGR